MLTDLLMMVEKGIYIHLHLRTLVERLLDKGMMGLVEMEVEFLLDLIFLVEEEGLVVPDPLVIILVMATVDRVFNYQQHIGVVIY